MRLWQLLCSFLQIGLLSIGGGYATLPLIQEQVVVLRGWLTAQEFTDIITISQMTPGPLAVNTSTFVGIRVGGLLGAVLATLGCVISGFVLSLLLDGFFQRHRESPLVEGVLQGLKATSAGLIASAASTILLLALFGVMELGGPLRLSLPAAGLFAAALLLLRKTKLHPILVMALCGAAGWMMYG